MTISNKLLPVTLQSFPACDNCISWSQDNIAVAGGESVHILTPKSTSSRAENVGHPQWQILNLRANLFRKDEWSEQSLATITDYSIGEEQSNSPVVALSWSNAGLGPHRSSVLGVLTSNLLLSLWEADGHTGQYKRSCIVNHTSILQRFAQKDKSGRRAQRIRSFAWLPPLKNASTSRWGHHYLAIANDEEKIIFLRVRRDGGDKAPQGAWAFDIGLDLHATDFGQVVPAVDGLSALQRRLEQQPPVIGIQVESWTKTKLTEPLPGINKQLKGPPTDMLLSNVTIHKGSYTYTASICASISQDGQKTSLYQDDTARFRENADSPSISAKPSKHFLPLEDEQISTLTVALTKDYFSDVLQPLRNDYNSTYQLFGHMRTKFWGMAMSTDRSKAVACVTLHPSDMVEYNIPSAEKCFLVFKSTHQSKNDSPRFLTSNASGHEPVLNYVRQILAQHSPVNSSFDRKLCRAYENLVRVEESLTSELKSSLEVLCSDALGHAVTDSDARSTNNTDASLHHENEGEECEICNSAIIFTSDTTKAKCVSGHQFTRCQLSFLAIQEPGISKYCSQCGKQFLDLTKLGPTQGSSFAQLVFDEFDLCPYCQGKYRG